MPRKQIGLKLEESDLNRWDLFAEANGLTRTSMIETAMEALIESDFKGVPVVGEVTRARGKTRRAFICAHETKGQRDCNRRVFLTPAEDDRVPDCPEHGVMVPQPNRTYRGRST